MAKVNIHYQINIRYKIGYTIFDLSYKSLEKIRKLKIFI